MLNRICTLVALAALTCPAVGSAQASLQPEIVDRVIAIVGDSAVLQTEVIVQAQRLALADSTLPGPSDPQYEAFLREVLDSQVDRLLVIQAAEKDTLIRVDDATIDQQITAYIDGLARQFGGQPALQAAIRDEMGMTLAEFREARRNEARQEQIVQLYMASQRRNARPLELSEEELRARFEELRPQMQQRPRTITFRQVVVRPQASDSAKAAAREEIDSLAARVRAGEDFAALAEQYSEDLGSAQLGGDVGWFRRGDMVTEFEDVAFALRAGQMGIAESVFGTHLILVERTRGRSEVQARHILKIPEVNPQDIADARAVASEVLERARAGEPMQDLFDEFGDETEPDSLTIAFPQISDLPPAYGALRTAAVDDVLGPLEFTVGAGSQSDLRLSVVKIQEIREAGAFTFEDVRPLLAQQLQDMRQTERILERLRANTYIDIRM
jgi:peptidyl-prolyl cis-trans isomerase SurA